MKKFAVLKKVDMFDARVVREFDKYEDADAFRVLMQISEEPDNIKTTYLVFENRTDADPHAACACGG